MTNRTPYTKADFAWAQWTAKDIKKASQEIISLKKERLATIKKIRPENRTFENTVYALQESDNTATDITLIIDLLQNVSPDTAIREVAKNAREVLQKAFISIERDPKIWQALKDYQNGAWKTEQKSLKPEDKKLFYDMLIGYKRMGLALTPTKQQQLKSVDQLLSKQVSAFRHNINKYDDFILATEEEMAGLSERYKQSLKRDKKGHYIITLAYPDYVPFMELAENDTKRKELSLKFLRKGGDKNIEILKTIISLRAKQATLLGYKNHVDYRTETRMAKTSASAVAFVEGLIKKVERGGKRDLAELLALKKERLHDTRAILQPYDVAYYAHELEKERFSFDSEELRNYFPLERVLSGTFSIYGTLFGVRFEKIASTKIALWHPDVELYAIKNAKGDLMSYFSLDLFPREGKFGHAAIFGILNGHELSYRGDTYKPPYASMVCNFTKPAEGKQPLLSFNEVETFLHEFGHVMHFTLTTARYASQAGYNTVWDFVEAPSQMLENWAWNKKSLALLSAHQETGKPIPPKLLANLLKSKEFMIRYGALRQLIMALFDLKIHMQKNTVDSNKIYKELLKKYTGITALKDSIFPAGFGHLDEYSGGYYSYMWSKVYAADMFTRFDTEGVLNKKTGNDYKRAILEQGGSKDASELVKEFLGRKPNNKAFLKEIGLS